MHFSQDTPSCLLRLPLDMSTSQTLLVADDLENTRHAFSRRGNLFLLSITALSPLSLLHTDKRKQRKTPNPHLIVTSPNYTTYSCLRNHKNNNFIIWFSSFIIGSRGTQTMRYHRKQSKFFKLPLIWPTLRTQVWIFFLDLYCLTLQTVKTLCKL